MVVPLISSPSPSPSSRSTRMRNFKNAISSLGVNLFNFNPPNVIYNSSNCGYPKFRRYLFDGYSYDGGSPCMSDFLSEPNIFSGCEQELTIADLVWYGELNDLVATSKNKIAGIRRGGLWIWNSNNFTDMRKIAEKTNNGINQYICGVDGIKLNPNYKD